MQVKENPKNKDCQTVYSKTYEAHLLIHLRKQCHWKHIHVVGREWIFFDYTYMSPSPNVRYSFSHCQGRSYIVRTCSSAIIHPSCFRWSACFCAGTESDSLAKPRHYLLWKESRMGRDVMSGADLPRKKLGDSHRTFGLGCPTRCQITQVMAILWYVLKARAQWTTMDLSLSGIDQRYRCAEEKSGRPGYRTIQRPNRGSYD